MEGVEKEVCGNAKNGKGFQVLAKGCDAQIVGKRIYYIKSNFDPNDKKDELDKTEGVYSMKLDGSDKKILLKKELICACQGYLYVKDLSDGKLMRYTLQGIEGKLIAERNGNCGFLLVIIHLAGFTIEKRRTVYIKSLTKTVFPTFGIWWEAKILYVSG